MMALQDESSTYTAIYLGPAGPLLVVSFTVDATLRQKVHITAAM